MRIPASLVLVVASLALVGCGHVRATTAASPSPVPSITSVASTSSSVAPTSDSVTDPGEEAAQAESDGQFSVVVFDRETGQVVVYQYVFDQAARRGPRCHPESALQHHSVRR
jgi:hypothetical protein